MATKVWPSERFGDLADRMATELGAQVHFLGGMGDRPHLEAIAGRAVGPHAYHWSLNLPEVVALISECDLFIGNDSGLSHIAAAVRTPMVVLWGPVNLSQARPKAPSDHCLILYHDLPCRATCPESRCDNPEHLACLMRTEVSDVERAARTLLSRSGSSGGDRDPRGGQGPATLQAMVALQ
jgi:ADP-heptose:LPS heptosyltransferase